MSATARQKSGSGIERYGQRDTDCFRRPFLTMPAANAGAAGSERGADGGRGRRCDELASGRSQGHGTGYAKSRFCGKVCA